jgi:hypothetical protein
MVDSENKLLEFHQQIQTCTEYCDLESEILFPKAMQESAIIEYNDMSILNDWVGEKMSHENSDVSMIPLQTEHTVCIADAHGTDFFCYTGMFSSKERRYVSGEVWMYSVLLLPILPITIIVAATPQYNSSYYFLLYNVRTGETKWTTEKEYNRSAATGFVNSIMYDMLYQVQSKPKK